MLVLEQNGKCWSRDWEEKKRQQKNYKKKLQKKKKEEKPLSRKSGNF